MNSTLSIEFLQQLQVHYNMNPIFKMMTEKLQMLVSSQVSNEQKVSSELILDS